MPHRVFRLLTVVWVGSLLTIGYAVAMTIVSVLFLGWLLIIGGVFEVIHGFSRRQWSGFFVNLLGGVLYAVAGVVNFKLRKNLQGLDFDAQYGITQAGDGQEFKVSALFGSNFADDRGNVTFGVEHYTREYPAGERRILVSHSGVALAVDLPRCRRSEGITPSQPTPVNGEENGRECDEKKIPNE